MSQNISEASQPRDNPLRGDVGRVRRALVGTGLWLLSGLLTGGCELVLGDIPAKQELDDGGPTDDAARPPDAAPSRDGSLDARAGKADAGAAEASGGDEAEAAVDEPPREAAVAPKDAATARDAEPAGDSDAAHADAETPDASSPSCAEPLSWYADRDGDGFGSSNDRSFACASPAGSWSLSAGDCNDADARAHPGQLSYFGTPHLLTDGSDSFDFDCSGSEEGNGLQTAAPDSCGLLSLTACFGSGYAKTARQGRGVNRLCGSDFQQTCQAAAGLLGCESATQQVSDPYRCR